MGKKNPENKYGVRVGDIFAAHMCAEDWSHWNFYQVKRLRGETQVVVGKIAKEMIGADNYHQICKPIPDLWISDEEFIKRVRVSKWSDDDGQTDIYLDLEKYYWAHIYDEQKEYKDFEDVMSYKMFEKIFESRVFKEIPFDVSNNSGVFFMGEVSPGIVEAEIRFPDGKRQKTYLKGLYLHEGHIMKSGVFSNNIIAAGMSVSTDRAAGKEE